VNPSLAARNYLKKSSVMNVSLLIRFPRAAFALLAGIFMAVSSIAKASENVPHRPFALWTDLPRPGQWITGIVYEESEAYNFWSGGHNHSVRTKAGGESYGIDINQGYLAIQYGIAHKWAADINLGGTTAGWRYFDNGRIKSTTGVMDVSIGVRYQIFSEEEASSPWIPTLTFRAGGVLPGTYSEHMAFAPGVRSAAIEPELLLRKHFGWTGFGVYGDALYRWNRTTGNDQYIAAAGFFQQVQRWELDLGYRHLQTISGGDIKFDSSDPSGLDYPRDVREISDAIEAGFSYTTKKRHIRWGFHTRTIFDGNNTDKKFWIGGSVDIPLGSGSK
jgi:hypothetical protein